MTEHAIVKTAITSKPFFKNGSAAFIETLSSQGRVHDIPKGHVLFINQDEATQFYIIQKGWVKLFRETLDGAQAVVDILPEGHIFGETSIFEDDLYPYTAEAAEPATVISLPLSALKTEIEDNPKVAFDMLSAMARYRKQQDMELEHMTLQNAPQRIGCFLLRLIDQDNHGATSIHLPYDKTLVASRLGMQPETFSRALSKLKVATGIKVKGSTIELESIEQLSTYSCAACSSEFPCQDLKA